MNTYTIKYGDTLSGIASQTGKSISELMQLNPSITDPNKIRAGATLSLGGTSTPAPSSKTVTQTPAAGTTTNNKPSIASVAKMTVPDFTDNSNDQAKGDVYKTSYDTYKANNGDLDQATKDAINASKRAALQGQIDAINLAVQDQISKFRNTTAKSRSGQSYALAAAGGRIGSASAESEFQNVEDMNNAEEQTYRDAANNKIAALMSSAAKDASDEINARRTAIQQGAEKYLEFLSEQSSRKQTQVSAFVKNMVALGVDPNTLSDADFQKLSAQYGVSRDQIIAAYNTEKSAKATADLATKKTESDIAKNNQFDLGEGQAKYVIDPVTGKATQVAFNPKTYNPDGTTPGAYTPGANPAVDAWVSQIKAGKATIGNVPANLKNSVIQAVSAASGGDNNISDGYKLANELLSRDTDTITGLKGITNYIPGTDAQYTKNIYNQLKGYLSLENRSKLKGSGAISDFESKTLERAASALDTNLSNSDFKNELMRIRGVLGSSSGLDVNVKITDPATGQSKVGPANRATINDAYAQGYTVEYQ